MPRLSEVGSLPNNVFLYVMSFYATASIYNYAREARDYARAGP